MHDKAHATIIWFECVVCLWFYCCLFRMIVLSFAKWHVDALLLLPHAYTHTLSRIDASSVYTHFHVITANCVTIWLIVRHMMLFCCERASHTRTMCKTYGRFYITSHRRWDSANGMTMMPVYDLKRDVIKTTTHTVNWENVTNIYVFTIQLYGVPYIYKYKGNVCTSARFLCDEYVYSVTWVVVMLLADIPSNELLNSIEFPAYMSWQTM